MRKFYHGSRADARVELGINPDQITFVSCGFIQESKGYDRVVSIFADCPNLPPTAHYHVVGSARTPESIPYRDQLAEAAGRVLKVTLHDEYVDDESFDRWIVAADYIVAPYRTIWSSSLLARAALHDRSVIATDVGGLRDQARPDDTIVADDGALARAIETLANKRRATAPDSLT
jgi:glycosyltransferase involved in cell wall biosynthesis